MPTYAFFPWAEGPMKEGKSYSGIEGASYASIVEGLKKMHKCYHPRENEIYEE